MIEGREFMAYVIGKVFMLEREKELDLKNIIGIKYL